MSDYSEDFADVQAEPTVGDTSGGTGDSSEPPSAGQSTEAAADTAPEPTQIPVAALRDERAKRQAAEARYLETEQRLAAIEAMVQRSQIGQQPDTQPNEPDIDYDAVIEDPRAVFDSYGKKLDQKLQQERLELSVEMAQAQFPDYQEVIGLINDPKFEVPGLQEAMARSKAPAFAAYRMIKQRKSELDRQTNGSDASEMQRQVAELKAELEAYRAGRAPSVRGVGAVRGSTGGVRDVPVGDDQLLNDLWGGTLVARR